MKTERMVLLVTPAEKALIATRAAKLGVSAGEYVRRAVEYFDVEDIAAIEELKTLLPGLEAMAERLEREHAERPAREAARQAEWSYYTSDAYRDEVRQQLLDDPAIDWERARKFFGGGERKAVA